MSAARSGIRDRLSRPVVEVLEPRRLLTTLADGADLFGAAQAVNVSSTYPSAAFAAGNVVDGTNAAFRFGDGTGPQRLAVSNIDAAIHTLRFFDTPSYTDRAAFSVAVYYSPARQLALTPASYTPLGSFVLATNNVGGAAQGDVYQTPTSPADHPRASDPSANAAATVSFDQITGLNIPAGTQSILLDFGVNPAGFGFGLTEIQALGYPSTARPPDATLLAWGQNVYQKTNASLQVPASNLYAETASISGSRSGGDSGFAYVWPESVQFRVLDDLVMIDPKTYTPVLRAFSDELYARYWQNGGAGGYRSGVSSGATLFYDDNGHVAVALAEAYNLTGDPVYLNRAIQTYQFVVSGEDAAGGGGIYFSVPDHSSKDAISTLQAVRAGLLLYQITGQSQYLDDATRLYAWAASHIQQSNGLFKERFLLTGPNAGTADGFTLINSAGIGLLSNSLFYDTTGNVAYLREAQRIANASIAGYFNAAGAINDEGQWAFELVDALDALYLKDGNPAWLNNVKGAMAWLHANREDPNGHYGTLWAREAYTPGTVRSSWNLIDQAAVAESYLMTAQVSTTPSPFVTSPGDTIAGFYQGSAGGSDVPSTIGTSAGQYPATEAPANAVDANAATKYLNYGNGNSSTTSPTKGVGSGFRDTPSFGPSIVTGIQVVTANDFPNRDPLTVSVEGTNAPSGFDSGAAWTLIADNVDLGIDTDPGRQTYGPLVQFNNTKAFRSYRIIVKAQRGSDNSVQYAEMNLIGTVPLAPAYLGTQIDDGNRQRSEVRNLTFKFSAPVSLPAGAISLALLNTAGSNSGLNNGAPPTDASVALDLADASSPDGGLTWVVPFFRSTAFTDASGSLIDGIFSATVHAAAITGVGGLHLTGGDQIKTFHRLYGDVTGDGQVSNADFTLFSNTFGLSPGQTGYNRYFDFIGPTVSSPAGSKISNADFTQFSNRFGKKFVYIPN